MPLPPIFYPQKGSTCSADVHKRLLPTECRYTIEPILQIRKNGPSQGRLLVFGLFASFYFCRTHVFCPESVLTPGTFKTSDII